ncbi:MAG: hypothetical protein NC131_04640 [Roseburia sp.]|nr:hypothetical protein [Roseburia sp.]
MEDYKYLKKLESVSPDNAFIKYIAERVLSDDYRGVQCSQHNRLTFTYFTKLVEAIYKVSEDDVFGIHIGDDDGVAQPQAKKYYEVVAEIKKAVGKGTVNSVKKNTFPDIARMGFLERYDKSGAKITEGAGRRTVYGAGLSPSGVKFATASAFEKIKLFTDGVDALTKNTASELVELLYLNDYGIDSIDILEFMYIISDDRYGVSFHDKLNLLLEYRRLTPAQKNEVNVCLKNFCNPENRRGYANKTLLRDYNNWKNESQQIYGLLSNSAYFKVENGKLILNTGNYGLFDEHTVRGERAKAEYFKFHGVKKNDDYELHHIVPFSKAENKSDALLIDNYKNLIYLKSDKHSQFTAARNKNVILKYNECNPRLLFLDFNDGYILVDTEKDALFNAALLPAVKEHNETLLKKFYYV